MGGMTPVIKRTFAEAAPTLADLKKLPLTDQSLLLLERLSVLYLQMKSGGGLHKGNLLLPNDPYQLAIGYTGQENLEVRRHFLGVPWTTLVNKGYLVDPAGTGFYSVSDEGYEVLKHPNSFTTPDILPLEETIPNLSNVAGNSRRRAPRSAVVINVLIASPSDVCNERDIVANAIYAWNAAHYKQTGIMLNPIRWETHSFPASGDRPQQIINKQIVYEGDFLIGIFGNRLGTPTGRALSGTIEEIECFRKSAKHVALYFSTADVPRTADRAQLKALEDYQRERQQDTLYFTFGSAEELDKHVTHHLPKFVSEVHERLSATLELEGIEEELRTNQTYSQQRLSDLAAQVTPRSAKIINAESLIAMRTVTGVRSLRKLESDLELSRLPEGVYGFTVPWQVGPDANHLGLQQSPHGTVVAEIHKSTNGESYVVGYISESDLVRLQDPSRRTATEITMFFSPYREFSLPVAIPFSRIEKSNHRSIGNQYVNDLSIQ